MLIVNGDADLFLTYCTNAQQAVNEVPTLTVVRLPDNLRIAATYGVAVRRVRCSGAGIRRLRAVACGSADARAIRIRAAVRRFVALLGFVACASANAQVAVTDATGRTVNVPATISKVYAAGPPASVFVLALAPGKLAGWTRALRADEIPFLPPEVARLPELGRLTGRGNTANVEVVMAARPDLIVDIGSTSPTYVSLAERVTADDGHPIPAVRRPPAGTRRACCASSAARSVSLREGEALAAYVDASLATIASRIATIPEAQRPRVFYARGPNGLATAPRGSLQAEVLRARGRAQRRRAAAGLSRQSRSPSRSSRCCLWQPDVIVTIDPAFPAAVRGRPEWQAVPAVKNDRIYVAPELPFGWIDAPPALNRMLGRRMARAHPASGSVSRAARTAHHGISPALLSPHADGRAGRSAAAHGRASRADAAHATRVRRDRAVGVGSRSPSRSRSWHSALGRYPDLGEPTCARARRPLAGSRRSVAQVVWNVRMPRIAGALLVGAALACAGAAFQQMFRNPLVAPDTLGRLGRRRARRRRRLSSSGCRSWRSRCSRSAAASPRSRSCG